MPMTLPIPIEFRLPGGWLPAAPPDGVDVPGVAFAAVHPHPDHGFTANITVAGEVPRDSATLAELADESAQRLREAARPVVVAHRREVGSADAPALTQRLIFSAVVGDVRHDLVQSQVFLTFPDVRDPHRRAMIRLALTATAAQHDEVLRDFQEFVRTVRPDTGDGA
ncbi:hypothetical protein OHA37_18080 [Streptomyces sp. NBC_00335]|uniref:hypothetical protein n=2 Tax=unclassified Streptomyces TaxID=2593676 RepID=UPI002259B759|nr:hypothetical protein [Streptomyces sp. NBC_00335]MCX5405790.1 hypothetical protein [Streptomyces sp. NBC_00086]